ncbi:hypothetical protein BTR23_10350 [Alkalihalophilus pseudofirmus]|nr:hypothetical protein BTR23_10350 [Alkalihalophilus pseudofirmus]
MYTVCLSEEAKEEFQTKTIAELDQVNKRIEMLRNGFWKNGTRVKKLKSINKKLMIFEARVNDGDRMLFTLYPDQNEHEKKTIILIFHLSVKHDHVIRMASNILNDEINMVEYEVEQEQEASFEELVHETEPIWNQSIFYHQFDQLKSYEIEEETITRFMNKRDMAPDEFWDLKLKLTTEQRQLLNQPLPILISGTAGSGKTTIIIHKMLAEPAVKKLYITYSEELRDEARRQFLSLVRGIDFEEDYRKNTFFMTFKDLIHATKKDEIQSVITKDHFLHYYKKLSRNNQFEKIFPPLMAWEEIRGVLKGGIHASSSYILSEEQYQSLGEQEAPNFVGKREVFYHNIFLSYQKWLEEHHYIDEQDILNYSLQSKIEEYDMVICDEVQDLSMLHIQLIFSLADNNPHQIIIAGDDHQVVHHSGFRWENIKNAFYLQFGTRIKDIAQLSKNFRNTGKIAELADNINQLQRQYTDFQYKTGNVAFFHSGTEPIVYDNLDSNVIEQVAADFGPIDAVLVRSDEEKEVLRKTFMKKYSHPPLIFTVFQAKGLEFNKVLLWGFFNEDSVQEKNWAKLRRIIDHNNLHLIKNNPIEQRFIRYEASMLYVAVTRGMKDCQVYDGKKPSVFWKMKGIQDKVKFATKVEKNQTEAHEEITVEDWLNQGKYLLNKKLYEQAFECFNRIKDDRDVFREISICTAFMEKNQGNYHEAGRMFEQMDYYDDALYCYETAECFDDIERLCNYVLRVLKDDRELHKKWQYQKNYNKVRRYDSEKRWIGSGTYCKRIGKYAEAIYRFEKEKEQDTTPYIESVYIEALNDGQIDIKVLKELILYFEQKHDTEKVRQLNEKREFLKEVAYVKTFLEQLNAQFNDHYEDVLLEFFPIQNDEKELSRMFDLSDPHVRYVLALLVDHKKGSEKIFYKLLFNAAQDGHSEAQFQLACYYDDRNDVDAAMKWYEKAAANQHLQAIFNYGLACIQKGDYEEGINWYEKAAQLGYDDAMSDLSIYYEKGDIIPKNRKKAKHWEKKWKEITMKNQELKEEFKDKMKEVKKEIDKEYGISQTALKISDRTKLDILNDV